MKRTDDADSPYREALVQACMQAIVRASLDAEIEPDRLRSTEINAALVHIIGSIAATTDGAGPQDPHAWAEDLAGQFIRSFAAARRTLDGDPLLSAHIRNAA